MAPGLEDRCAIALTYGRLICSYAKAPHHLMSFRSDAPRRRAFPVKFRALNQGPLALDGAPVQTLVVRLRTAILKCGNMVERWCRS